MNERQRLPSTNRWFKVMATIRLRISCACSSWFVACSVWPSSSAKGLLWLSLVRLPSTSDAGSIRWEIPSGIDTRHGIWTCVGFCGYLLRRRSVVELGMVIVSRFLHLCKCLIVQVSVHMLLAGFHWLNIIAISALHSDKASATDKSSLTFDAYYFEYQLLVCPNTKSNRTSHIVAGEYFLTSRTSGDMGFRALINALELEYNIWAAVRSQLKADVILAAPSVK